MSYERVLFRKYIEENIAEYELIDTKFIESFSIPRKDFLGYEAVYFAHAQALKIYQRRKIPLAPIIAQMIMNSYGVTASRLNARNRAQQTAARLEKNDSGFHLSEAIKACAVRHYLRISAEKGNK